MQIIYLLIGSGEENITYIHSAYFNKDDATDVLKS